MKNLTDFICLNGNGRIFFRIWPAERDESSLFQTGRRATAQREPQQQRAAYDLDMAELGDSSFTDVEDIAAVGDVILVVGPEQIRLRVHSLTLKATSQAFSAMLGSNWKEGRDLIGKGLVNLLLPEDNAMAMKYVCAIIHHQNKMLPNDMAPPDILDIAITADKYNFVDALRFASGSWLQSCNLKADELMTLTAAAYAFQNAQAFRDLTKALILNYGGSYFSLSTGKIESVMSWKVFCKNPWVESINLKMTNWSNQVFWKNKEISRDLK